MVMWRCWMVSCDWRRFDSFIPRGIAPLSAQWMALAFSGPLVSSLSFGRDKGQLKGHVTPFHVWRKGNPWSNMSFVTFGRVTPHYWRAWCSLVKETKPIICCSPWVLSAVEEVIRMVEGVFHTYWIVILEINIIWKIIVYIIYIFARLTIL